jgi:hypothetical protein
VVSQSYEFGATKFGVRTNSEVFAQWLDEAIGKYRIDEEQTPHFSVHIAETGKPGKRFHVIYVQTRVHIRARTLETTARALVSQLERVLLPEREDAIYGEMSVVVSNGVTMLVPPILLPLLEAFSKREIARAGLVLPYATTIAIDPSSGDLVPMPRVLDVAETAYERLRDLDSDHEEPRVAVDSARSVDAVVSFGGTSEPIGPISKAQALYRAASHSLNLRTIGGERGLAGLRKTVERAACFELGVEAWKTVPQRLASILRP